MKSLKALATLAILNLLVGCGSTWQQQLVGTFREKPDECVSPPSHLGTLAVDQPSDTATNYENIASNTPAAPAKPCLVRFVAKNHPQRPVVKKYILKILGTALPNISPNTDGSYSIPLPSGTTVEGDLIPCTIEDGIFTPKPDASPIRLRIPLEKTAEVEFFDQLSLRR
ncbi:MAG: hypothetical protein R3C18_01895 [Planctomycetaceae bacterium]